MTYLVPIEQRLLRPARRVSTRVGQELLALRRQDEISEQQPGAGMQENWDKRIDVRAADLFQSAEFVVLDDDRVKDSGGT